jgi:nitrite reductase/ring-hydroxylating ferredoxin subunit
MAATSHDFWNTNLGPGVWKAIHMGVYIAYVLLVAHIMLGVIQFEKHPLYVVLMSMGVLTVSGLHLFAGFKSRLRPVLSQSGTWLRVATAADFIDGRGKIVRPLEGESIAIFRNKNKISAISNVCRHQGGPLGEGRIIDDCVTCPWHGFQYRLEDGTSPEPFTEKISTYKTKIVDGVVFVNSMPS